MFENTRQSNTTYPPKVVNFEKKRLNPWHTHSRWTLLPSELPRQLSCMLSRNRRSQTETCTCECVCQNNKCITTDYQRWYTNLQVCDENGRAVSGMFEWTSLTRIQNLLERRSLEKLPNKLRDLVRERGALQFGSLLKIKVCISLQTYMYTQNNK